MTKLVEMVLEDLSTREVFQFQIRCGLCRREYANNPVKFSKAGIVPQTKEKQMLYDAVYEQERSCARNSAVKNTAEHFNYCPICKQLVCNRCFLICEDLDMCIQCADKLKEKGAPVIQDEIAI